MTKILALVNSSKQFGVAANAAAHASLGLASRLAAEGHPLPTRECKEGTTLHPPIVDVPIEVRSVDAETLRECRRRAISKGLSFTDFTQTMTGDTYVEQLEKTKSTDEAGLEYYCVVIAGSQDDLAHL
jgi:hypothetical protein